MDNKLFFLIGTLVVSLTLVPSGTAQPNEEPEDTFEDVPFPNDDDDDLFTMPGDQDEEVYHALHFRRHREKPMDLLEP